MTVFGASGDLAARKLYPALAGLARDGMLPDRFALVGTARSKMSDDDFRQRLRESAPVESDRWTDIVARARYVAGDYDDPAAYQRLAETLDDLDRDRGGDGNRLFYLAAVPAVFAEVITAL
jgi:glucose-6-phosphate 1-dehydrogenase